MKRTESTTTTVTKANSKDNSGKYECQRTYREALLSGAMISCARRVDTAVSTTVEIKESISPFSFNPVKATVSFPPSITTDTQSGIA